jgi:hypothetical protein
MFRFSVILLTLFLSSCIQMGSPEMANHLKASSDIAICNLVHDSLLGALRSDAYRYKMYKVELTELDRRRFDCREFPSLKDKWSGWKRKWVAEYEKTDNEP